jgi:hypothetical protein
MEVDNILRIYCIGGPAEPADVRPGDVGSVKTFV